jgi:hypothetical protein
MYRAGERTRFTRNLGGGRSLNRVARNTIQGDVSGRQGVVRDIELSRRPPLGCNQRRLVCP